MRTVELYVCPDCGVVTQEREYSPHDRACKEDYRTIETTEFVSLPDLLELIEGEAAARYEKSDRLGDKSRFRADLSSVRGHELELLARRIRKETQS